MARGVAALDEEGERGGGGGGVVAGGARGEGDCVLGEVGGEGAGVLVFREETVEDLAQDADVVVGVVLGVHGDAEAGGECGLRERGGRGGGQKGAREGVGAGEAPVRREGEICAGEVGVQEGGVEGGVVRDEERGLGGRGGGLDEGAQRGDDGAEGRDERVRREVGGADVGGEVRGGGLGGVVVLQDGERGEGGGVRGEAGGASVEDEDLVGRGAGGVGAGHVGGGGCGQGGGIRGWEGSEGI